MDTHSVTCLINLLAACLLDPTHITLRAESHWLVTEQDFYSLDGGARRYRGPLGRVEITAGGDLSSSLRLYYGVGHQSFITTRRDTGYEYLVAGFEWHPFR